METAVLVPVCEVGFEANTAGVLDARAGLVEVPATGMVMVAGWLGLPGTLVGFADGLHRVRLAGGREVWVRRLMADAVATAGAAA